MSETDQQSAPLYEPVMLEHPVGPHSYWLRPSTSTELKHLAVSGVSSSEYTAGASETLYIATCVWKERSVAGKKRNAGVFRRNGVKENKRLGEVI